MSEYSNAVKDLLWISRRVQGVLNVIPQLEEIASLENTINEAKAELARLFDEIAGLQAEKASTKEGLKALRATYDKDTKKHEDRLKAEQVEAVLRTKKAQEEIIQQASDELKKLLLENDSLRAEITANQTELVRVSAETSEAKTRLSDITDQINSLKAKF